MKKNPFKKIQEINDSVKSRRERNRRNRGIAKDTKRDEKKMKAKANEAEHILQTESWEHFDEFVKAYEDSLERKRRALIRKSASRDKIATELIKIETKLLVLDDLRGYPSRCIEEVRKLRKNL